jgi:glycosyltransferase involved in cell wall biosynthesis
VKMDALGAIHARAQRAGPPRIVHVSADFPDSIEAAKTPVVRTLVDLVSDRFDQQVISLNRRSPRPAAFLQDVASGLGRPQLHMTEEPFDQGVAISYVAPPRGLYHATMLHQLGNDLARRIAAAGTPALIVGHKLSVEGVAVHRAARLLGCRYAISIQGDTDTKILSARPDLARTFARVFHEADMVFPFAPWALRAVEAKLGARRGPVTMLPCPTDIDVPSPPRMGGNGLLTCFHLKNHERKNLPGMAKALRLLAERGEGLDLAVVGGGSDEDRASCDMLARNAPGLRIEGPLGRQALKMRMKGAKGFVMPSLRESFGLVFIEALFCGLPILYPAGTSIDGYLDGLPFALRVDAHDSTAIAAAMQRLVREEDTLKTHLRAWQASDDARRFTRAMIGTDFAKGLIRAISVDEPLVG